MPARDFPFPTPGAAADRFAAWERDPGTAAPAKLAATVILMRDGAAGVEVFMQRRVASMAFAARRAVFPGGSIDARDREPVAWAGPDPCDWSATLGLPADDAAPVVVAAARELFEEAGVLLATPGPDAPPPDPARLEDLRRRILGRELSLGAALAQAGLLLRTDLLGYCAHWVTPDIEPRRYDTYFFTALLPAGQQADAETTEAESAEWVDPGHMLQESPDALMPPTVVCLEQVAAARQAADLVRVHAQVPVIRPVPVRTATGWAMRAELP